MAKIRMEKKRTHGVKVGGIYTVYDRVGYWMVRFVNRPRGTARVERVALDGTMVLPRKSIVVDCDELTPVDAKTIKPTDAREKVPAHAVGIPDRLPEKLATAHLVAYGRWPMVGEVVRALGKKIRLPDGGGYPMPDVRRAFLEYAEITFAISTGERMEDERFAIPVRPEMNFNRVEKLGEQVVRSLLGMQAAIDSKGVSVDASLVSDALTTIIARVESMTDGTKRARNDADDAFGAVRPCFSTSEVLKNCSTVP